MDTSFVPSQNRWACLPRTPFNVKRVNLRYRSTRTNTGFLQPFEQSRRPVRLVI
jgi:hypothetical protein